MKDNRRGAEHCTTGRHTMTRRTEAEIDQRLAATAAEYVDEEQAAAEEEAVEEAVGHGGCRCPRYLCSAQ